RRQRGGSQGRQVPAVTGVQIPLQILHRPTPVHPLNDPLPYLVPRRPVSTTVRDRYVDPAGHGNGCGAKEFEEPSMDEIAERLARLCAQAGDDGLRERAERYGVGEALTRLGQAARAGSRTAAVTADLDALDDAFARHGIDGLTVGPRGFEPLRGGRAHPVVTVWGCPAEASCSRLEPQERQRGSRTPPPACALTGTPLVPRKIRL
ncbi:hypothetical protein ABT272_23755, partial [Streptomyces sp900105245]